MELADLKQLINASTANAEDGLEFLYCVAALVSDDSVARVDIIHVSHSFSNFFWNNVDNALRRQAYALAEAEIDARHMNSADMT